MNQQAPKHHAGYTRKSVPEDIPSVASRLREADINEIHARHPDIDVEDALRFGFLTSAPCHTMVQTSDGLPLGMWGIVPSRESPDGYVWMLCTDELVSVPKNARRFLVDVKRFLPLLLEVYPTLSNLIDSRNIVHLKFIEWLGFEIDTENVEVHNDVRFYPFHITMELYNERWSK